MKTKFSLSMEHIPRQRSFACLSLKFGSILSALIVILYSVLSLAQCFAASGYLPTHFPDDLEKWLIWASFIAAVIIYTVTLFLSALMLIGVLRERASLIKPWIVWTSLQLMAIVILFIFYTVMSMGNYFGNTPLLIYIIEFLGILVRFYMLMLVASYYKQLIEDVEEYERLKELVNREWYSTV